MASNRKITGNVNVNSQSWGQVEPGRVAMPSTEDGIPILAHMECLHMSAVRLNESVCELEKHLDPVLNPQVGSSLLGVGQPTNGFPNGSHLGSKLSDVTNLVDQMTAHVREIINRAKIS